MVSEKVTSQIEKAVAVLKRGGVVVFPTETAYALGADARNEKAVERVRVIKGREAGKSFPLIAGSREMVERFAGIPRALERLAREHWPGALTLVLPTMGEPLAFGVVRDGTVAVRVSSHEVARMLSERLGALIVSTSANRAGEHACYSVACVREQLGDAPDYYLDAGDLTSQSPSTIVALDDYGYPEVLRQGGVVVERGAWNVKRPENAPRSTLHAPRAKKSFGQNWLVDETVVGKIIAAAEIVPGEHVLEIGPGTGVLTQALVDAGARVTAVEADASLIPALRTRFGDAIELIHGDVLSTVYRLPSTPYALISNIPYNITSDLLRRFLTTPPKPSRMILMVQREVADRITAAPPDMSLLSVVCQLYARCRRVCIVPAGAFRPVPKVDSAIVRLDPYSTRHPEQTLFCHPEAEGRRISRGVLRVAQDDKSVPLLDDRQREAVIALAKLGFSSRRKQLHRNLSSIASPQDVKAALTQLGLPPTARAQELGVEQWVEMARSIGHS